MFRKKTSAVNRSMDKLAESVLTPSYYMKSLEYYYKLDKQDYFAKLYKDHFQHSLSSIKFINSLDKEKLAVQPPKLDLKKKVFYKGKQTIIFDLDET